MAENSEQITDGPLFSFGVVTDVQGGDKDTEKQKFYRDANRKFEACIDAWNQRTDLSFCIQLGDIIEGDPIQEENSIKEMNEAISIISNSIHPLYHVIRNHCLKYPGGKPKVIEKLNIPSKTGYYEIEHGIEAIKSAGHRFLVLDGTDISINPWDPTAPNSVLAQQYLDTHPIEKYSNSVPWNGAISQEQLTWLENKLKDGRNQHQKIWIFCHYPIFLSRDIMHTHLLWNGKEVCDLLDQYKDVVVAWMCGHFHRGGATVQPDKWAHITLEAVLEAPEQSYGIVKVYANRIEIEGTGSCSSFRWNLL